MIKKFRAWSLTLREFLYKGVQINLDGTLNISELEEGVIIQQFSGWLDKNRKEIYEGDIVNSFTKQDGTRIKPITNTIVRWDEEGGMWVFAIDSGIARYELNFFDNIDLEKLEVVGNIFETK